jgi:hypothetical protein
MRARRARALLAAAAIAGGALSCGEVPSLPEDIAFVSTIQPPSPAVVRGDTLRDTLGVAAPLRVRAFDRDGNEIAGVQPVFLVVSGDTTATVSATGILVAKPPERTVRLVAQVAGRLQTPEFVLDVVPPVDTMTPTTILDTASLTLPARQELSVTATGLTSAGTRIGVKGVIVRFAVVRAVAADGTTVPTAYLIDENGLKLRGDSTLAVDTTSSSGVASRFLLALRSETGQHVREVQVRATARTFRGAVLGGSPLTFTVRFKP